MQGPAIGNAGHRDRFTGAALRARDLGSSLRRGGRAVLHRAMATRSTECEARMRTHHGGLVAVALMVAVAGCARTGGAADTAPSPAVEPTPQPSGTAFEGPRGWIAFNDGTGIWAVNPWRTYPGTFSPTKFPDDMVRLAGPAAGDPIAWSADGSRLLVRRPANLYIWPRRADREALFVLEADGTETQVTEWVADETLFPPDATISPDGTQVVYVRGIGPGGDHPFRLEMATVGHGSPAVLLTSEELHYGDPVFSPDGRRIAYIEGGGDHANGLWVMDADGTNRRKVAGGDWGHVYDRLVAGRRTARVQLRLPRRRRRRLHHPRRRHGAHPGVSGAVPGPRGAVVSRRQRGRVGSPRRVRVHGGMRRHRGRGRADAGHAGRRGGRGR
jgi:hypothetical protein